MDAPRVGLWLMGALALAPATLTAQGWIEPPGGVARGFAVERVRSDVRVEVEGRVARVEVSEWFRNGGARVAEGEYLYPLPGEAVFEGFSLFQGGTELRGEIMDADRARAIYEEIVRRRADPALIELAGHALLRARIFPIEPGDERKVTLRYTQVLSRAGDALQLRYAGAVRGARDDPPEGRTTRTLTSEGPTSFEVVVADARSFLDPFSPTHALDVTRGARSMTVRLEDELVGRVSIFLPLAREAVGLSVATHRPVGEDGYVMLTLSPGRDVGEAEPRDVTAVLDVSGSMSGEKIAQARSALRALLETLDRRDRFRLIAFSNSVRMHSDRWVDASTAELDRARAWVEGLAADGGTNIGAALDEAFRLESPDGRLPLVIFLTDGLPSVGEQSPERLADQATHDAGRARVFAFGVGHDVNTHLLDRLGEAGRGSTQYVEPGEDVERALGLLALKIRHPVLTDIEIDATAVRLTDVYPVRLPDVFAGEELVLFARYSGEGGGRIRVRGARAGRRVLFQTDVDFPDRTDSNGFIPRLWASRKLGHLMRQLWIEGESASLVEEIRKVAVRYGLPSPYTSYLVQEPERVADGRGGRFDDVRPAERFRTVPAPIQPADASGAAAVRRAEEARTLRETKSVEGLRRVEAELASARSAESGTTRALGGRIFRLEDGVWVDEALDPTMEVVRVKAFSPAWFRLTEALPEVRPVLGELGRVAVAGVDLALRVADDGIDALDARGLERIVLRFRGRRAP